MRKVMTSTRQKKKDHIWPYVQRNIKLVEIYQK